MDPRLPNRDPRGVIADLSREAVRAASPLERMRELLPRNRAARVVVVDAGKAAGRIAADLETIWQADPLVGVVVVPYDHRTPTSSIAVMEASHPVPDRAGLSATKALFDR